MVWYPLYNSLRIALLATILVFFTGIGPHILFHACRVPARDFGCLIDPALVLPPTVVGYFLLCLVGPRRPLGMWLARIGCQLVMQWPGAVLASAVIAFR